MLVVVSTGVLVVLVSAFNAVSSLSSAADELGAPFIAFGASVQPLLLLPLSLQ